MVWRERLTDFLTPSFYMPSAKEPVYYGRSFFGHRTISELARLATCSLSRNVIGQSGNHPTQPVSGYEPASGSPNAVAILLE